MSEERQEPSIDPQPGELGDGQVDVRGGTEFAGGRDMGAEAGRGTLAGSGPGGMIDEPEADDDEEETAEGVS